MHNKCVEAKLIVVPILLIQSLRLQFFFFDCLFSALANNILIPPSKSAYNFSRPTNRIDLQGQFGQPTIINRGIFKGRIKNGFFIEAGAYDGESYSNSLFFEMKYNWTGILVEANPDAFAEMKLKHRKSWLLGKFLQSMLN